MFPGISYLKKDISIPIARQHTHKIGSVKFSLTQIGYVCSHW